MTNGWEKHFSKYYGAMFECGDFEALMDDIRKVRAEAVQMTMEKDARIAENFKRGIKIGDKTVECLCREQDLIAEAIRSSGGV